MFKKKKKHNVIYYKAPDKRRASYFLAAFFITLAVAGFVIGIAVADNNSLRLGWNESSDVFAVMNSGKQLDVTMMGKTFKISTDSASSFFIKVRQVTISIEPEPLRFIEIAQARMLPLENQLMSCCKRLIP